MIQDMWWDASFRDLTTSTFGAPAPEYAEIIPRLAPGSRVLDVGCGDGRHSLALARHGMRVTAFDVSSAAIRKLSHLSAEAGLRIDARVADLRTHRWAGSFDLVIAHSVLQHVARPIWEQVIPAIQRHTAPGGLNVITVMTSQIPLTEDLVGSCPGLFRDGELFRWYADWVERDERSYLSPCRHGDSLHTHSMNKIIATRPAAHRR